MRIRGRIGDWPVDLTLELDEQDWARLAQALPGGDGSAAVGQPAAAGRAVQVDAQWQAAQELLAAAGSLEGPQLLGQLAALAGGEAAAKRLLVRLRHCPQVRVEAAAATARYTWIGGAQV